MRVAVLLTALAGASSSVSAAVMRIAAESMEYNWAVTGWSAGCAKSGCSYDFNITGAENLTQYPKTPAFKAYCAGFGEGSPYRLCDRLDDGKTDAIVVAKLLPSNTTNGTRHAKIQVSLKYTDLDSPTTWWNFTGHADSVYNQFVAPLQNFTITPSEITGVA
ncbi:hypothetical protein F5Y01DRAFT_270924 [Xylaria sp. FL0043]|nr:hypothetical protein F5Y01DRAFT_270924 [Xylaria sp. FL0043]